MSEQINQMSETGSEPMNQMTPTAPQPTVQNLPVPINQSLPMQVRQTWQQHRVPITIGVGALVLSPILFPLIKPVAKATIKSGVALFEKTKGAIAETAEVLGDIVAEAKAELASESQQKVGFNSAVYSSQKQSKN